MELIRIPQDVTGGRKSKMVAAILNFRLPVTSGNIRSSAIVLLDLGNDGLDVGTVSLSGLEADI